MFHLFFWGKNTTYLQEDSNRGRGLLGTTMWEVRGRAMEGSHTEHEPLDLVE